MRNKKKILLKLSGSTFESADTINELASQIKKLQSSHLFGIVIGGGNFFHGKQDGKKLGLTPSVGHHVGMVGTIMNGLILKDLFEKQNLNVSLFSSIVCPSLAKPTQPEAIDLAVKNEQIIIFSGGTALPFFTTDTNAIVRALQIGAKEVWKATDVKGVYDNNPKKNPDAKLINQMSYSEALEKKIEVMDSTAFTLAATHKLTIRIFNIFSKDALIKAAENSAFGSKVS